MPQKHNPVGSALALAAANRVPGLVATFLAGMVQEHERGVGGWQAEWATISDVIQATGLAAASMAEVAEGLRVNEPGMRANIEATHGGVFAERAMMLLGVKLGRDAAHKLVQAAALHSESEGRSLAEVLAEMPEVKSALRVVDDKLCVGGLAYGQDYSVRLLAGLPARDGSKLAGEQKVDVALGARPAVVSLPGKGFILPRAEAVGLPVTTVNVSRVGVAVYRVNERGLQKFIGDDYVLDSEFPGGKPLTERWSLR